MFSLKDRVALVTGASQGIGRATALALAQAGARVAVAARNAGKLAGVAAEIAAAGDNAFISDGYSSASYPQQRADQIDLQLVGLKAELMRREAEIAALNDAKDPDGGSGRCCGANWTGS